MPGKKIITRLGYIFISLFISFFLWLSLAGQDTSTIDLSVPLDLAGLPSDLRIRGDVPNSVNVQLQVNTAQGRFLAERKPHLYLNLATAKEGQNVFPINHDTLELPRGAQVRNITPQILEFEAIRISEKVVPLRYTVSGSVGPAYRVHSVITEPDTVTVQGPAELLALVDSLPTTAIDLEGLTRDTELTVKPDLSEIDPILQVTPSRIKVKVHVEEVQRTETFSDLPISIDLKSSPEGLSVQLAPQTANVAVSWPASRAKAVTAEDVRVQVFVDASRLMVSGRMTVPVVVVPPSGVTVTAISPVDIVVTPGLKEGAK